MGHAVEQHAPTVNLSGIVQGIRYKNSENGWAILRIKLDKETVVPYCDKSRCICALGSLANINMGQRMSVTGKLIHDPKWGPEVKVEHFSLLEPQGITEIVRYLTHNVKFVGEFYSQKIVDAFGLGTLKVLDENPDRLYDIKGIDRKRAEGIKEAWKDLRSLRDLLMFATAVGIGHSFVAKIHKEYGEDALSIIRADPYRLARDIEGIGFKKADEIAQRMGVPEISDIRVKAASVYLLDHHANMLGDCFMYAADLVRETAEFLENPQITPEFVKQVVTAACRDGTILDEDGRLYSPKLWDIECGVAERLLALINEPLPDGLQGQALETAVNHALTGTGLELHPLQQEAVQRTLRSKLSVITGGPGVGKTTVTRAIVAGYKSAGLPLLLLAPTGRAAKRMSEVIGANTSTIHRYLYGLTKRMKEGFCELNEVLIRGVVIVDEASMIDIKLMRWLLTFLHSSAVLVLVGDNDQLPSIGPGSVLRNLIESPKVATTKLTYIFRQAAGSDIVRHAHAINQGTIPPIFKFSRELLTARGWPKTDFFLVECDDQAKMAGIIEWCATFMARKLGFDPAREVQVLTPMRKGDAGVMNLNKQLQQQLNPEPPHSFKRWDGTVWGVGDRLMQIVNNYNYGIFNGDQGIIEEFAMDDAGDITGMRVNFDGLNVDIAHSDFNEMTLSYACTVHKSQGSEYPMVVMAIHRAHFTLLQRNLLYTGITRSRKVVVLVADPQALSMAVRNNQVARRNTFLTERLANGPDQVRRVQEPRRPEIPEPGAETATAGNPQNRS